MIFTKAGKLFLLLILGLLLSGMNTNTNLFHLLTGFLVALLAFSPFLARKNLSSLSLQLDAPTEVFADELYRVQYTLTNHSVYDKFGLSFHDPLNHHSFSVPHFPANTSLTVTHEAKFSSRGKKTWKKMLVKTDFPFAFFTHERFCSLTRSIYVLPRPLPVFHLPLPDYDGVYRQGSTGGTAKAVGHEFAGMRDYFPGDDPRWIHWKATAKTDRLIVKEHEEQLPASVAIFVDTFPPMLSGLDKAFEGMICTAASLVWDVLDRGYLVSFFSGGNIIQYGRGRQHGRKILRRLAETRVEDHIEERAFEAFLHSVPSMSTVLLVSIQPTSLLSPYIQKISTLNCHRLFVYTRPTKGAPPPEFDSYRLVGEPKNKIHLEATG